MITKDIACELLDYDSDSGLLKWRKKGKNKRVAGAVAGTPSNQYGRVYLVMSLGGKMYRAHRVIWLMVHGRWPVGDVDHKNGDTLDNRLVNLRECSRSENLCNQKRSIRNTSGVKGVHWNSRDKLWEAKIHKAGRSTYIGRFTTLDEAREARERAAAQIHGEFARLG